MEEVAISIELDLHYFWSLNPNQFNKHLIHFNKKTEIELRTMDEFAHLMGMYVMYAFNDPERYPVHPLYSGKNEVEEIMSDEDMEKVARRNTLIMGGEIK